MKEIVDPPLVSVGFGTYKGLEYIEKALESLLKQTYTNIELIIADNGSFDGSGDICRAYANTDKRVRYHRHEKNIGAAANFNFLLAEAKGKYFMWAADDDIWHPDFIKVLVESLEEKTDAVSAMTPVMFIDDHDKKIAGLESKECTNYAGPTAFKRLYKLIRKFEDSMTYGLFRTQAIGKMYFPSWKGINKADPINSAYPVLAYLLAKGDFVLAGNEPMWFNRLKSGNYTHNRLYSKTFLRYMYALANRKIQLISETKRQIRNAGGSWILRFKLTPGLFYYWFLKPCIIEGYGRLKLLFKGKISFF